MTCNHKTSKLHHFTVIFAGSRKNLSNPFLPRHFQSQVMQGEEAEKQGEWHRDAGKALKCLLWLSRLSRPDLSFIICIFIGVKTGDNLFPIHWQSRKQSSIARSTPEAEMIAFAMYGETLHVQAELVMQLFELTSTWNWNSTMMQYWKSLATSIPWSCVTAIEFTGWTSQRGNSMIPPCQWQVALNQLCVERGWFPF